MFCRASGDMFQEEGVDARIIQKKKQTVRKVKTGFHSDLLILTNSLSEIIVKADLEKLTSSLLIKNLFQENFKTILHQFIQHPNR